MTATGEKWFTRFCDRHNVFRGRVIAHLLTHDHESASFWKLRADGRRDIIRCFQWSSIQKVIAYKADLITYDEIYLNIGFSDGQAINVSEEAHGFMEFAKSLPSYLPGCLEWSQVWQEVALPAFKANETTIYERA